MKKLIVLVLLLALLPVCKVSASSYSIEGWVFIDTNLNGVRETWKGETGVLDNVLITLSNGATKRTSGGWYGFNVQQGTYIVSIATPEGYDLTSSQSITVVCNGRMIDRNFGAVVASSATVTPEPTPLPDKYGIAIANDITLDVAQNMGARRVLIYWPNAELVASAYARGMQVLVSIPDCNLTPAIWQKVAILARDYPDISFSFLNEPDLYEQAGQSCGATNTPYDVRYDLTKVHNQLMGLVGMTHSYSPSIRWVVGNESVAIGDWLTSFGQGSYVAGWHIYPSWWNGESVDNYTGWSTRLNRALTKSTGNVIITEVGMQGATDKIALADYLTNLFDSNTRAGEVYWLSWEDAPFVSDGSLTPLGMKIANTLAR